MVFLGSRRTRNGLPKMIKVDIPYVKFARKRLADGTVKKPFIITAAQVKGLRASLARPPSWRRMKQQAVLLGNKPTHSALSSLISLDRSSLLSFRTGRGLTILSTAILLSQNGEHFLSQC